MGAFGLSVFGLMDLFPGEVADREAPDGPDAVVLTTPALQGRRRVPPGRRPPHGGRRNGAGRGAELDTDPAEGVTGSAGGPVSGLRAEPEGEDHWDPSRHNT